MVRKKLLLKIAVHRAKLLSELVSDSRHGARVCVEEARLGCWWALVGLAHAWELLSQALVPNTMIADRKRYGARLNESLRRTELYPWQTGRRGRLRGGTDVLEPARLSLLWQARFS